MIMKAWMMVNQKAMMAKMIKYLETQEVDSMDQEDLVMVMDLKDPEGPIRPVGPVFISINVKHPICPAKDDEDAECHLPHSNGWMNLKGISDDAKYGRFCLILVGDTHLWHHSITHVGQ